VDSSTNDNNSQSQKTKKNIGGFIASRGLRLLRTIYFNFRLNRVRSFFGKEKAENINLEQTKLDKKLIYSLAKSKIPNLKQLKYLRRFLSPQEVMLVRGCLLVILFSLVFFRRSFLSK